MKQNKEANFLAILETDPSEILAEWMADIKIPNRMTNGVISDEDMRNQCRELLSLFRDAAAHGDSETVSGEQWDDVKEMLENMSRSRARQGYTPTDIAEFVLSLKKPLFRRIGNRYDKNDEALYRTLNNLSDLIDGLALWTSEVFQKSREELIVRQQADMLEISTPVVQLWDGILALPIIGTLDSARTQIVMENLLQAIVDTGSEIAIIDITGVPTVDTLVSQHLLKTVSAAQLMGAECIISGIRPQIAQTIVHLGVDLSGVITKATLEDAFKLALWKTGASVTRASGIS